MKEMENNQTFREVETSFGTILLIKCTEKRLDERNHKNLKRQFHWKNSDFLNRFVGV